MCLFENRNLVREKDMIESKIKRLELEYRLARTKDLVQAQVISRQLKTLREDLLSSQEKLESLRLKAPQNGEWIIDDQVRKAGM